MKHKIYDLSFFALIVLTVIPNGFSFAQVSLGGIPKSFEKTIAVSIPEISLPEIDLLRLKTEDEVDDKTNSPLRFAVPVDVNLNLQNAGVWSELSNGDRVWRLKIHAPNAVSINFLYDQFYLPPDALLYIYTPDRTEILGAFAAHNNKTHGKFATALLHDDTAVIEYYEPLAVQGLGSISISQIGHGYRSIDELVPGNQKNSGDCQVDINCSPEGDEWQETKNSVTRIIMDGAYICTGTLINNTSFDQTPYVLSANHCINFGEYDAVTNPETGGFVFYWNYESSACGLEASPSFHTTVGASLIANSAEDALYGSDFALFLLDENPAQFYDVHFAGFDASGITSTGAACIHHPMGDLKKIATASAAPTPLIYDRYWQISWDQTPNGHGVTEGGSSGSALLNNNQQIIGQLYGGSSVNCSDPVNDWAVFGQLAYSWDNNGATDSRRRLKDWLDPINQGETNSIDGLTPSLTLAESCKNLFISEYIEGTGLNRCIEIFNPNSSPVALAEGAYHLKFYFEGNTSPGSIINLTDTIPAFGTYVVCDDGADSTLVEQADLISYVSFFNGDDAIELLKGSITLDCFGTIGHDPGIQWGSELVSTRNKTLRRKAGILIGDRTPDDEFTPEEEWDGFNMDDSSDLGAFECDCQVFKCPLPELLEVSSCSSEIIEFEVDLETGNLSGPGLEGRFFNPVVAGPGEHQVSYSTENDTCIGTIIVRDATAPVMVGREYNFQYTGTEYYLQDEDVIDFDASTDDCGYFQLLSIEPEMISCSDIGQTLEITFFVEDDAGNEAQGTALITVTGAAQLPSGWLNEDIGSSPGSGSVLGSPCEPTEGIQVQSSTYTSESEHGHFVYQQLCGDGSLEVEITQLDGNGYAGVMFRESLQDGAKMISLSTRFSPFIYERYRSTENGNISTRSIFRPGVKWLKLERAGNLITGYCSTNGSTWQIAFSKFVEMEACLEIGIFSQTNSTTNQFIASFENLFLNTNEETDVFSNPENATKTTSIALKVFPNPTANFLHIQLDQPDPREETSQIEIRNAQGQLVMHEQLRLDTIYNQRIPVSQLDAGIYFLTIKGGNNQETVRFVKQ